MAFITSSQRHKKYQPIFIEQPQAISSNYCHNHEYSYHKRVYFWLLQQRDACCRSFPKTIVILCNHTICSIFSIGIVVDITRYAFNILSSIIRNVVIAKRRRTNFIQSVYLHDDYSLVDCCLIILPNLLYFRMSTITR